MSDALVSVIMPTYNHAQFIGEAIQSVLSQTYSNWELLIVNNYSEDNTVEIVQSFKDQRIKLFNFHNNGVIAASRNEGIKQSAGEYIAFLDSDDLWKKDKLEKQVRILNKFPEIVLTASDAEYYPKPLMGLIPRRLLLKVKNNSIVTFKKMVRTNTVINSSVLMRKSVVDSIGYLDEKPEMRAIEDYDYWLRILEWKDRSIYLLKNVLVSYRLHQANISTNPQDEQSFNQELKKIMIIFDKHIARHPDLIHKIISERKYESEKSKYKKLYAAKKIGFFSLFTVKDLHFPDKCEIWVKVWLSRVYHFIKR